MQTQGQLGRALLMQGPKGLAASIALWGHPIDVHADVERCNARLIMLSQLLWISSQLKVYCKDNLSWSRDSWFKAVLHNTVCMYVCERNEGRVNCFSTQKEKTMD